MWRPTKRRFSSASLSASPPAARSSTARNGGAASAKRSWHCATAKCGRSSAVANSSISSWIGSISDPPSLPRETRLPLLQIRRYGLLVIRRGRHHGVVRGDEVEAGAQIDARALIDRALDEADRELRAARDLGGDFAHMGHELIVGQHLVDDAQALGLGGVDQVAGPEHPQRPGRPDKARQAQ